MIELYKSKIFPALMKRNIGKESVNEYRRKVLMDAEGKVLEIGFGTGANTDFYPEHIKGITAIDTYTRDFSSGDFQVELYNMSAKDLKFNDETFDTVVSTFTLCSINNLEDTLKEIRRVLKSDGKFIYLEHGKNPNKIFAFFQEVMNPLFNIFACGCHINRDFEKILLNSGYSIEKSSNRYISIFPKILVGYVYSGIARKDVLR